MLLEMFFIFFKIGAFTFGGGYAMLPIIQEEIVDRKGWIKEENFIDALVVAQSAPGPVAVNLSIYAGQKVAGLPGAIMAVLGTVMPSFLIILVVVKYLYQYRNHPIIDSIFMGITPAIVGLITAAVFRLIKTSNFGWRGLLAAGISFLIIVIFNVSAIYLIVAAATITMIYKTWEEKKREERRRRNLERREARKKKK